jgi:peptidoglycan hydrolase-like protein with peptidoglycan-binding domain
MKNSIILSIALAALALTVPADRAGAAGNDRYQQDAGYGSLTPNELTQKVQLALEKRGYYTENDEGRFTTETRAAVRRFQRDNNLRETGTITPDLLRALGIA